MAAGSKSKRAKRITGIGIAASALSVTRQHLGLVLHGLRESKPLIARYHNWKKEQCELHRGYVRLPKQASRTRPKRPAQFYHK